MQDLFATQCAIRNEDPGRGWRSSEPQDGRSGHARGTVRVRPLGGTLFLIAGVAFVYTLFFADSGERRRAQLMMMGAATTIVVVTLLAIVALNRPNGHPAGSIRPVAMKRSLNFIHQARATLSDRGRIPCDAAGAALTS